VSANICRHRLEALGFIDVVASLGQRCVVP
jgi:hypothetical protein